MSKSKNTNTNKSISRNTTMKAKRKAHLSWLIKTLLPAFILIVAAGCGRSETQAGTEITSDNSNATDIEEFSADAQESMIPDSSAEVLDTAISGSSAKARETKLSSFSSDAQGNGNPDTISGFAVEEREIVIPGLTGARSLVFLADLHITQNSDEVGADYTQTVSDRERLFTDEKGRKSADAWADMAQAINALEPDAVLMGGDMVDFASEANLEVLQNGLSALEVPYLYVRADHDYGVWYDTMEKEEAKAAHREIDGAPAVNVMDMGDFLIVGVDNNTSQISEKALEKIRKQFSSGKPVILLLHVPLESTLDTELNELSMEAWQDRALIWGADTYYTPNETTQAFLDLVYAENSPVTEVLCGHLHFRYEGYLTEGVRQFVAQPAYQGNLILISVHG